MSHKAIPTTMSASTTLRIGLTLAKAGKRVLMNQATIAVQINATAISMNGVFTLMNRAFRVPSGATALSFHGAASQAAVPALMRARLWNRLATAKRPTKQEGGRKRC